MENNYPILVIDDEIEMRIAIKKSLEKCNFKVEISHNVKDAISKIEKNKYILVITDMTMPKKSGMEILNYIKKNNLNIPSIMITAHGTISTAVEAIKNGAFDFIEKPFHFDTLIFLVERALESNKNNNKKKIVKQEFNNDSVVTNQNQYKKIITKSKKVQKIIEMAKDIAMSNSTVLIQAESGTGKELLSQFLHYNSKRKDKPFIAVNCAALPETLLESELFGHKKGSFTGAIYDHKGKFEQANGGTILLDEISEIGLQLQAKLLRVIQEKKVVKVGDNEEINLDIRIIATTNRKLFNDVTEGKFREDLYFRLNVIPLTIPPLRDRKEDIDILLEHFIEKYGAENNKLPLNLTAETKKILNHYHWRGNIRELENVVERAVILSKNNQITSENLILHTTH